MDTKNYFEMIHDTMEARFEAFRTELRMMYRHYRRHADREEATAANFAVASGQRYEALRAASYNMGRAAAIKEVLELIGGAEEILEHNGGNEDGTETAEL